VIVAVVGCSSAGERAAKTKRPEAAKPKEISQTINLGPATFDKLDEKRQKLWIVRWKSAKADISQGGDFSGTMETVDGDLFQGGKVISVFSSNHGKAIRQSKMLGLSDHVQITAKDSGTRLTCQTLTYDGNTHLVRATGNVRIEGKLGVISGIDELITTPELKIIATPTMWGKP
jgi:hypothetical protein